MRKPLNIILAAPGKGVGKGGVVRQMQYLLDEGKNHNEIKFHWLCTHSNNALWPLFFITTLVHLCWMGLTKQIDFLHLNIASKGSFYRKWILFRIAKMLGIKHIAHLHGGGFKDFYDNGNAMRKARIEELFQSASTVLVLGKVWQEFAQSIGVEASKVHILHNAVPTPPQASIGGGDIPHLIFVGHLLPRKGVDELIETLADLKDLNWRATLAGSGELARYQAQVAQAGLGERVSFAGWLDDAALNKLYQEADILLLPSHIENQPLSILEAQAHGLAVICTNVGTVSEITNKNTAITFELPHLLKQLKIALVTLLENPKKLSIYKEMGRIHHLNNFNLTTYFSYYYKILIKF